MIKKILLTIFLTSAVWLSSAYAATVVWTGANATNIASDPLNWDTLSAPTTGDDVIFDGVFPVTGSDNCTWDITDVLLSNTITAGYGGTITASVTCNWGDLNLDGGILDFSGQDVNVTSVSVAGSGVCTLTMGATVLTCPGNFNLSNTNLTFNKDTSEVHITDSSSVTMRSGVEFYRLFLGKTGGGSSTVTLTTDIVVNDAFNYNTDSGTRTINDNKVFVLSDAINSASSGATTGTTIFEFSGAVAAGWIPNATGGSCGNPVIINRSGTTLTFYGTIKHGGNFTYTAGTVDATTQTTNYQRVGAGNLDANTMHFYDFSTATTGTTTLTGALNVDHDFTIGSSTTLDQSSYTITLLGNYSRTGTISPGTSVFNFDAISGTKTITGGFFATVNFKDGGSGPTYQLQNAMDSGDLTIDASAILDVKSGTNASISVVGGSWTNNGTFLAQQGTVTITGSASTLGIKSSGSSFYNLTFSGPTSTMTLIDPLVVLNNFTSDMASFDVDVVGNFQITVGGNWSVSGLVPRAGTVLFNAGNGTKSMTNGTSTFYDLQFTDGDGGGSHPIYQTADNITTFNLTIASGATLDNLSAGTITVTNGWVNSGAYICRSGNNIFAFAATGNWTYDLGPDPFYDLRFSVSGSSYILQRNLVAQSTITVDTGAGLNDNAFNITVGAFVDFAGTYSPTGKIIFNATTVTSPNVDSGNTWGKVQFNGSGGGWSFAQNMSITDIIQMTLGTLSGTHDISGPTEFAGNGTVNLTGGTITMVGGGFGGNTAWTINNLTTGGYLNNITKVGSGAVTVLGDHTVTGSGSFDAGTSTWNEYGNFDGGALTNPSTGTFRFLATSSKTIGNAVFYNLEFNGVGGVWTQTSATTVSNLFTITNGIFDLASFGLTATGSTFSNLDTLRLQGGQTITGLTMDTNSGIIAYNGTGTYTELAAGDAYFTISIESAGGVWTLDANLDVNGNLNLESTAVLHAQNFTINCAGDFNNNSNGFDKGTSTVIFDGVSNVGPNVNFYNLTFASGATVIIPSNQQLQVDASGTFTATHSTVSASSPGVRAALVVSGAQAVDHVTATDIDSSGGNTVINTDGSISNTINWTAPSTGTDTGNFFLVF